jgi:hypothetical protein
MGVIIGYINAVLSSIISYQVLLVVVLAMKLNVSLLSELSHLYISEIAP